MSCREPPLFCMKKGQRKHDCPCRIIVFSCMPMCPHSISFESENKYMFIVKEEYEICSQG